MVVVLDGLAVAVDVAVGVSLGMGGVSDGVVVGSGVVSDGVSVGVGVGTSVPGSVAVGVWRGSVVAVGVSGVAEGVGNDSSSGPPKR